MAQQFGSFRSIFNGKTYGVGRFSPETPIDISQFPTVTAARPAETVSSRYSFIPTTRPLEVLADYGWFPVAVEEARIRDEARAGFQKHVVRLAHPQWNRELAVGGTIPQVLLSTDHAGGAAFEFLVGLFEKVCANQLCVSRGEMGRIRVLHRGYADALVEQSIRAVMEMLPVVLASVELYKAIELTREEQRAYAEQAIELRWDGEKFAVDPERVLNWRHSEQRNPTLWNVYNRVQENIIRGGVRQTANDGRRMRSRAVTSVAEDLRLNKALWTLTEETALAKV